MPKTPLRSFPRQITIPVTVRLQKLFQKLARRRKLKVSEAGREALTDWAEKHEETR